MYIHMGGGSSGPGRAQIGSGPCKGYVSYMYVHIIWYYRRLSDIVWYHPMHSLWSDPILFPRVTPYFFHWGTPYFFGGGEPPGDRAWAFPNFKFGGNVIPYLGGGITRVCPSMGVLEHSIVHPDKILRIWPLQPIRLSPQEPPRNSVLRAGLNVQIPSTLTWNHS